MSYFFNYYFNLLIYRGDMSSVWAVVSVNKNKFTIINADFFIGYLNKKSRDIVTTYIYDEKKFSYLQ